MMRVLLDHLVLETLIKTKHCHSATLCNNTLSAAWVNRMAAKSSSPVAHRLLRGLALRQRINKTALPMIKYIAGPGWQDDKRTCQPMATTSPALEPIPSEHPGQWPSN